MKVAATAVIEPEASVGPGTTVWDHARIRRGAKVGSDCTIGGGAYIDAGVVIGDRCKIQDGVLVYAPAVLADGVFVGPRAVLTNDRRPRAIKPDGTRKEASDWAAEGVQIDHGAAIGAGAVVLAGCRVGAWAMVAAGAVVRTDVAPFELVGGVPARRLGWVGPAGARLEPHGDDLRCPVEGSRFRFAGPDAIEPL